MNKNELEEYKKFAELSALKEISLSHKAQYEQETRSRDDMGGVNLQTPKKTKIQIKIPTVFYDYLKASSAIIGKRPGDNLAEMILLDMETNIDMFKEEESKKRSG